MSFSVVPTLTHLHPWWHWFFMTWVESEESGPSGCGRDDFACSRCRKIFEVVRPFNVYDRERVAAKGIKS